MVPQGRGLKSDRIVAMVTRVYSKLFKVEGEAGGRQVNPLQATNYTLPSPILPPPYNLTDSPSHSLPSSQPDFYPPFFSSLTFSASIGNYVNNV